MHGSCCECGVLVGQINIYGLVMEISILGKPIGDANINFIVTHFSSVKRSLIATCMI